MSSAQEMLDEQLKKADATSLWWKVVKWILIGAVVVLLAQIYLASK